VLANRKYIYVDKRETRHEVMNTDQYTQRVCTDYVDTRRGNRRSGRRWEGTGTVSPTHPHNERSLDGHGMNKGCRATASSYHWKMRKVFEKIKIK
jgi:hypothetical protein